MCNEQNPLLHLPHTQVSPSNKLSGFKLKLRKYLFTILFTVGSLLSGRVSLGEFYHPVVRFAEDGLNLRYTLHLLALLIRIVPQIKFEPG
jgi:hypothetical protein